jgi:hypothetical protein
MKLIALRDLPNQRAAGEVFEAPDDQARVLVLLGQAMAADVLDLQQPHSAPVTTEATEATEGASSSSRRRIYRRRDLAAESSED